MGAIVDGAAGGGVFLDTFVGCWTSVPELVEMPLVFNKVPREFGAEYPVGP
jgi:hypothetical protein